ncbi:MAG: thioredoxin domain-containing protein [Byssovorax sp.]
MAIFRCAHCGSLNRMAEDRARDKPVCGKCKARLDVTGAPQAVSGAALGQAVAQSPVPVLVDYWAAWCGPCRTAAPILEKVGQRAAGRLLVLKVNVDEERDEAGRRGIQGIPAFLLFDGGREVGRRAGVASQGDLEGWIAQKTVRPADRVAR